jgi:hypothetical protein
MKFQGKFINEKGEEVTRWFELPTEEAFKKYLAERGWRSLEYKEVESVKSLGIATAVGPSLSTIEGAKKAIEYAAWAAFLSAAINFIFATMALSGTKIMGIGPESYIDVLIFSGLGFGTLKANRLCGVGLFVYFLANQLLRFLELSQVNTVNGQSFPSAFWYGALVFGAMYLNGMRGVFAYHRLMNVSTPK